MDKPKVNEQLPQNLTPETREKIQLRILPRVRSEVKAGLAVARRKG